MGIRQHDFTIERRFRQWPGADVPRVRGPGAQAALVRRAQCLDLRRLGARLPCRRQRGERGDAIRAGRCTSSAAGTTNRRRRADRLRLRPPARRCGSISVSLTTVEVRSIGHGTRLVFTEHGACSSTTSRIRPSASTAPACCSTGSPRSSAREVTAWSLQGTPPATCRSPRRLRRRAGSKPRRPAGKRGRELHWLAPWRRARERGGRHRRAPFAAPPRRLRHGPQHVWPDPRRVGRGVAGWWGPEPPYHAPGVRPNLSRSRADRDGGRDDVSLRHRWLRRRLRPGPRDCRRRRHRHRGRRLDRPPSAAGGRHRRAQARHRPGSGPGPASVSSKKSNPSGWSPSRCCTRRSPTHIRYRRAS